MSASMLSGPCRMLPSGESWCIDCHTEGRYISHSITATANFADVRQYSVGLRLLLLIATRAICS